MGWVFPDPLQRRDAEGHFEQERKAVIADRLETLGEQLRAGAREPDERRLAAEISVAAASELTDLARALRVTTK